MFRSIFTTVGIIAAPATVTLMMPEAKPAEPFVNIATVNFEENLKFGPLLNSYFGGVGEPDVPTTATINYTESLKNMWDKKLTFPNVSPATRKSAPKVIERFERDAPLYLSIEDVAWIANYEAQNSRNSIDWFALCDRLKMNARQCENSIHAAKRINGTVLVSYSMTELMPGTNGKLNVKLYDKLTQTAGWTYVSAIPAMHDKKLSFGPYQFTSFAIYDDGKKADGASIVSRFAERKIPSSVMTLGYNDQHVAANYFAIYNIMRANKRFKDGIRPQCFGGHNLPIFIATAHNNPKEAINAMVKHVRNDCAGDLLNGYKSKSVKVYGLKTVANFEALNERI